MVVIAGVIIIIICACKSSKKGSSSTTARASNVTVEMPSADAEEGEVDSELPVATTVTIPVAVPVAGPSVPVVEPSVSKAEPSEPEVAPTELDDATKGAVKALAATGKDAAAIATMLSLDVDAVKAALKTDELDSKI